MPAMLMCIVLLTILFRHKLNKITKAEEREAEAYKRLEKKANRPIRRPLTNLSLLTIPTDTLPLTREDTPALKHQASVIQALAKKKICNLNGISNTELKLKYGAGNLSELAEYDQNYIILVRTLADWGEELFQNGYDQDAITVCEFAIQCKSDVSKTYSTLAKIYKKQGEITKIYDLITIAEPLSSTIDLKRAIYNVLNDSTEDSFSGIAP